MIRKKIYKHYASESQIQSKLINKLKKQFPSAFIVKLSDVWLSGLPDVLMINDGSIEFFEVKTSIGKVTPIQMKTHEAIRGAGALVTIWRG